MTPSTIYQPLNNVALAAQQGEGVVAQVQVELLASDALISLSASAWSAAAGEISIELWMDGQPTGGRLAMYANTAEMHLSLGRTYVWLQDVDPGQHTLELVAGPTTVTDSNDVACVAIWQMGDGCAVRFTEDAPCPTGVSQPLIKEAVGTKGGQLLLSASTSGWAAQAGNMVQGFLVVDGGDGVGMEVFPNNASQHLATVPTDLVYEESNRGQHLVQVNAGGLTSTDGGDTAHIAVVEWVNPQDAPAVLPLTPPLQDATANSQGGSGGTIAAANFTSGGGTLLIRVGLSCWTNEEPGLPLYCGIQIDGTSHGFCQIWANFETTHMAMVPNDLVLNNIPAGLHTLGLLAEANVITDANDRVSALVMEFPPVS
jgi:hypothetical protein